MKTRTCFPILLLLAFAACKKGDRVRVINTAPCSITARLVSNGQTQISNIGDGTLSDITWFNNGQLGLVPGVTDTTILDSLGRLLYYKQPFYSSTGTGRKEAQYFYDNLNRVVRTVTHTGNGVDYLADLTYENGDVVLQSYSYGFGGPHSDFGYRYYDTLCPSQYFAFQSWNQIGITLNRHLLKAYWDDYDTTYYWYELDSKHRVTTMYKNYDNSGWTYARATDTTYFTYGCD